MAVLMRRLITDAQAKLRRMVEEHSANLAARIDTDYPNSIPAPIPDPACFADDIQISNSTHLGQVPDDVASFIPKPLLNVEEPVPIVFALADADSASESKRSTFISSRPSSIESRRSKSLCNTSSLDSSEDARAKRDVKKTKSNPVKCESLNITIDSPPHDDAKADDAFEDNASASARDSRSSPDTQSSEKQESPKAGCSTQRENDSSSPRSPKNLEPGQAVGAAALAPSPSGCLRTNSSSTIRRLRLENERLQAEITRLRRLVVAGASSILTEKVSSDNPDEPTDRALEMELQLAKEALITLKSDRRRLKAEKFDLLNQMKQLYATLEDKEKELRDFIRNYEQRVRDNETSLQQLSTEREERERERWSLLRHARDEAERSLSLAAQLNAKELQLQQAQEQLQDARRQLASSGCLSDQESLASLPRHSINGGALTPGSGGLLSGHHGIGFLPGDRGSCSADSGVRVTSDRESGANSVAGNLSDSTIDGTPAINIEGSNGDGDSTSIVSSIAPSHIYQSVSTKDCSPTLSPLNANSFSRSVNAGVLSRSVEQLSSPLDPEPISVGRRLKHSSHSRLGGGRGGTWGSISRVFARSRHRNKTNSLQENSEYTFESHRSWSPLSEEGYAEKLRLLREASSIPMEKWRAPTVLAWLEVALGMPQYGSRCAENIKSGKVLLELSDLELECGLGITHPMHRKKVRLAIEEHRQPSLVRYPCIAQLGHTWVASEWLSDLGLSQYAENFAGNLVDARMLEHLSKKELEKYLGITRKFHQASIVHGIHLLRIMKYDRQALAVRRHQCENVDADPLVWTNQRFIRWTRSIDLSEYADNLKESGVHGGLVVLEPSFNGDTMATALGIPASKNIIRRHLNAELEALVLPARSTLEHYVRVKTCVLGGGSLGRSFSRSCAGLVGPPPGTPGSRDQSYLTPGSRRTSLKGSISRAFGSITKSSSSRSERSEPEKQSPTSSECSSVISRTSFSLHQFRSSRSGGESPIYSTPFAHQNNIYNRRSEEYDSYAHSRALQEEYEMNHHSSHNVNISPNEKNKSFGNNTNSIHRSHNKKRQHRRVKSIGDIDVIHIEPV